MQQEHTAILQIEFIISIEAPRSVACADCGQASKVGTMKLFVPK